MAGEFQGFPKEALRFLRELEANNDRDWFRDNKGRYDQHLVAPAKALGKDLEPTFGPLKLFRPYRDTRFHPGPPIKEALGMRIGDVYSGGGYAELSLDGFMVAAGIYMTAPDQIARWRAAVDDGRKAAPLTRAIAKAEQAGFVLHEPDLKRVPRGFDPEHPRGELLRLKRFAIFWRDPKPGKWLHTPACGELVADKLTAARPFMRWLGDHVGPSQTATPRGPRG